MEEEIDLREYEIEMVEQTQISTLAQLNTSEKKDAFIRFMIEDYSKKEGRESQKDLPNRCFSLIIEEDDSYLDKVIEKITEINKKSQSVKKPFFIYITLYGHSYCLFVFNNKICITDSIDDYGIILLNRIKEEINKKSELNNIEIKNITMKQQSDYESCPYFTGFNIIKFDKWILENSENFNKLFFEEELPLSVIKSIQSVEKLKNRINIDINIIQNENTTEDKEAKTKKVKFKEVKKSKKKSKKQDIAKKLFKYFRYNKSEKNFKIFVFFISLKKCIKDINKYNKRYLIKHPNYK